MKDYKGLSAILSEKTLPLFLAGDGFWWIQLGSVVWEQLVEERRNLK